MIHTRTAGVLIINWSKQRFIKGAGPGQSRIIGSLRISAKTDRDPGHQPEDPPGPVQLMSLSPATVCVCVCVCRDREVLVCTVYLLFFLHAFFGIYRTAIHLCICKYVLACPHSVAGIEK